MEILTKICDSVKLGRSKEIADLINAALKMRISPDDVLNKGLIAAMKDVGRLFKRNEVYIPEVLVASNAMDVGLEILKPLLLSNKVNYHIGTIIIGTVKGDIHNIGKHLVAIMFESAGFKVVDIGVNVDPEIFIAKAREYNADIVAMSALLTTTMRMMKIVIDEFQESGYRENVKILIGGAPVTNHFAQLINADGYAANAGLAVDVAKDLLNKF